MTSTMQLPSFDEFQATMRASGYEEVLVRPWAAGTVVPGHTHPFQVNALVVEGEIWLSVQGGFSAAPVPS